MTKEQIQYLRSVLDTDNLTIITDNTKLYHFDAEDSYYEWIDDKELLKVILTNTNIYEHKTKPYIVEYVPYDVIEYMYAPITEKEKNTLMKNNKQ